MKITLGDLASDTSDESLEHLADALVLGGKKSILKAFSSNYLYHC